MEYEKRFQSLFSDLNSAYKDLEESLMYLPSESDTGKEADLIRNGIVQKFEIVSELLWKTGRFFLLVQEGEDIKSPKKVIKGLYAYNYVDEPSFQILFDIMDLRIQLTHIYRKAVLDEAIKIIPAYGQSIGKLILILSKQEEE